MSIFSIGAFVEVGQVIAGAEFINIFKPQMALKNDARKCIDES